MIFPHFLRRFPVFPPFFSFSSFGSGGGPKRKPFEETTSDRSEGKFVHDFLDEAFGNEEPEPEPSPQKGGDWKLQDKCSNCQHPNEVHQIFCSHCGTVLRGPAFIRKFRKARLRGLLFWMLLLSFQLIAPFVYLLSEDSWTNGQANLWTYLIQLKEFFAGNILGLEGAEIAAILLGLHVLTWVMTSVLFATWIFRAYQNLPELHCQKNRYSSFLGASVFTFPIILPLASLLAVDIHEENQIIIPVLVLLFALMAPYLFMREMWKGSCPSSIDSKGISWKKAKTGKLLYIWYLVALAFPIALVAPLYKIVQVNPDLLRDFQDLEIPVREMPTPLFIYQIDLIIPVAIVALSTFLTLLLLATINYRQKKRLENIVHAWEHAHRGK